MPRLALALIPIALIATATYIWHPWRITVSNIPVVGGIAQSLTPGEHTDTAALPTPKIDPANVRSLYLPAWVFANPDKRKALIATAKASNANALVIDVKDTTGVVMPDGLADWVREVREAGLLPIARVVCFQDNEWAKQHPEFALQNPDGTLWKHKGLYWLDPAAPQNAQRVLEIAQRAMDAGFLEINLDYVRFPTDGNVEVIHFPVYVKDTPRAPIIAQAVETINTGIKAKNPDVTLSADLYAFSFLVQGDVGIGQQITTIGPHLDVIAPMIYPSHYSTGNFGFAKPAEHPYAVTDGTLRSGLAMLNTLPEDQRPIVRPWIQTFNLGAIYTPELVKASRQAVIDNTGHDSWMAWNPTATYEPAGLKAAITAAVRTPATSTQP